MVILLDLDGVLITTPAWQPVPVLADGFSQFNPLATANLAALLRTTQAAVVLTTSHRVSYPLAQWAQLLAARGLHPAGLSKVNAAGTLAEVAPRDAEILAWVQQHGTRENYVVLDDDTRLHSLPRAIRQRCVITSPLRGLDADATRQAQVILGG